MPPSTFQGHFLCGHFLAALLEKNMSFKVSRYGWLPDLPDHRNYSYLIPANLSSDFWTIRVVA
jgi:hypothetical protein